MLRTALRPRYLGLLALMVAATLVCGLLASWQWDRAHRAITDQAEGPVERGDVREVIGVGDAVTNEIVGDIVTASGQFAPDEQVLVPGRRIDGREAVIVVTALHVPLADGTEARLPVARGWIEADAVTGADGELDPALAPPAPTGEVTVTGRLEASEPASDGVTGGVTDAIATPLLVNEWGAPMYSGYLGQTSEADGLAPMPEAESAFSRGLDWQNLGYAAQWILFGAFFLYLWWRSVRTAHLDELADRREAIQARLGQAAGETGLADPAATGTASSPAAPAAGTATCPAAPTQSGPTPDKDV